MHHCFADVGESLYGLGVGGALRLLPQGCIPIPTPTIRQRRGPGGAGVVAVGGMRRRG